MSDLKFSVCITTYNRGHLIVPTINSILTQGFTNFELIISDNNSDDNTEEIVRGIQDKRIRYFKNDSNVGYCQNLQLCKERAGGDILYLMSPKNILLKDALFNTYKAFKLSDDIGAVTRAYYWFGDNLQHPVRTKEMYDRDLVVTIDDNLRSIIAVFRTLDNPAGLAYRMKYIDLPFPDIPFVEFAYPFASIFKKHKVVLLKDYTMAVPAWGHSGSHEAAVYMNSPMQSWINLFNKVFYEDKFKQLRKGCIRDFVAVNYVGLAQIKNYAPKFSVLLQEIYLLVKYRWSNLFNVKFWVFSIGAIVLPRWLLKLLVAFFKARINSRLVASKVKAERFTLADQRQ